MGWNSFWIGLRNIKLLIFNSVIESIANLLEFKLENKLEIKSLFQTHSIKYDVPENFSELDKEIFYEENFNYEIPAINQVKLNDVLLTNTSIFQGFLQKSSFINHKKPSFYKQLKEFVRTNTRTKTNIEIGILGIQEWSNNYFHWMTEMLPRIVVMKFQHPKVPVIIPKNYLTYPFIVQSLQLLNIDVVIVDLKKSVRINTLYAVPVPHVGRFNEGLMHFFRNKVMVEIRPIENPQRLIYISRGLAKRRKILNEKEVFEMLKTKGFQMVELENISLKDQVELFKESKIVIGNHGAGLSNIMFMEKKQTVIELKSEINNYWCYFSLARVFGLNYYYDLCKGDSENHRDANIFVDINNLNQLLSKAMAN